MLRDIKQQSNSLGAKIIMGLIIISFAFWGVGSSIMSVGNDAAASVNGEKISLNDFSLSNQAAKNRMTSQFGDSLGSEYFETENFKRGVMNQMVDAELLKQVAEDFDYDVAPSVIKDYIESSPGLQIDGKFSKDAYANYLKQVNKSAELLQRDIKNDIKKSALPQMIIQTSFSLSSEVENQYKLSKQKRSFNYIEISGSDYQDKVEVTDEEVQSHYNEFGQDYMTTEMVSVNYIELSASDLLADIELAEEDILTFYNAKKDSLMTAEKRKAQHILLPVSDNAEEVKVEIEKIATRLSSGEDFAVVAKEVSQDPGSAKEGGDLGWIARGDMVEAFDEKLFAMVQGDVSEPVLSTFGYHIIKLNEVKSPEVPLLEDIKETLVEELKLEQAEEMFLTKADELDTVIVDADNVLEIAAENSGLEIKSTELFARGRGTGTAANQNFSTAAFSEAIKLDGETSEMIDLGENHIAYIHISEHNMPVTKPLEEVSVTITTKLKSEKSLDLAKSETAVFVDAVKAKEKTLEEVATELGKTVVEASDIERVGSKQPFNLVKNVFSLKFDNDHKEVVLLESSPNAFAIVDLIAVVVADASAMSEEDKTSITTQIERTVSNNELTNVTKTLRDGASITINEKVFEEIQ